MIRWFLFAVVRWYRGDRGLFLWDIPYSVWVIARLYWIELLLALSLDPELHSHLRQESNGWKVPFEFT